MRAHSMFPLTGFESKLFNVLRCVPFTCEMIALRGSGASTLEQTNLVGLNSLARRQMSVVAVGHLELSRLDFRVASIVVSCVQNK